jgi:hypothetical protein
MFQDDRALAGYEEAMFVRSESEAVDADEILDLCLGYRAPFGLLDFLTSAPGQEEGRAPTGPNAT